MISARSHVEEITNVALGKGSQRDAPVVQSWLRCLNDYRLDPARAQEAYIVPATQLKEHRDQADELIRISRTAIEALFRHVMDQNYVLLLSDARGVTVDFMGNPTFNNQLQRAGLYLGSEWSENRAGTCAVGACLVSGDPVIIHQDDHFDTSHIGLTCTAAPIFDTLGDLTAVLDISQLRSPTIKASQHLALHLVTATARRIELANLMARTRHDWILRISRSPDFLDVDPEAVLTIDPTGRISGMTHGGFRAFARMLGLEGTRGLIGAPISRFFDIEIDDLPRFIRGRSDRERVIRTRSGVPLFAGATAPVMSFRGTSDAMPRIPRVLRELSFGDPAMEAVQMRASKLAARDVPILIQGETGAGKEFLARAIHDAREDARRFVAVNCAAIPESLIESELFGYTPGAFTGAASRGKVGLIEAANGGTLFLDEIGDMPLELQARLLRVLSEGEITPVGAHRPKPVSFRLISASHHRIDQLVADGRFRRDLFFRLNAATLVLPALRERQDLDGLIDHLLGRISADEGRTIRLSPAARMALRRHNWPGNLRELANTLRVATAFADGLDITPEDLPEGLRNHAGPAPAAASAAQDLTAELAACGGNVSELARKLGVDRSTIHRRLRRLKRS